MKKLICITLGLSLLAIADVNAAKSAKKGEDSKKPVLNEEQKTTVKDLVAKYDSNKDGILDKAEIKKMTDEDQTKYKSLMGVMKKAEKKSEKKGAKPAEKTPEKPATPAEPAK